MSKMLATCVSVVSLTAAGSRIEGDEAVPASSNLAASYYESYITCAPQPLTSSSWKLSDLDLMLQFYVGFHLHASDLNSRLQQDR